MALLFGQGFSAEELAKLGLEDAAAPPASSPQKPAAGALSASPSPTLPTQAPVPAAPAKPLSWAERMRASAQGVSCAPAAASVPASASASTPTSTSQPAAAMATTVTAAGSEPAAPAEAIAAAPPSSLPAEAPPDAGEGGTDSEAGAGSPGAPRGCSPAVTIPAAPRPPLDGLSDEDGAALAWLVGGGGAPCPVLPGSGSSSSSGGGISFSPRGLVNNGNTCFMNTALQALMACPPFGALMAGLGAALPGLGGPGTATPTLAALGRLARELGPPLAHDAPPLPRHGGALNPGPLMEAVVAAFCPPGAPQPRGGGRHGEEPDQHDAQEFLTFLLDAAHQELLLLRRRHADDTTALLGRSPGGGGDEEEWEQVGKGNRSAVTRGQASAQGGSSHVSAIFGGALRSEVRTPRARPSATRQHFTVLHLDIYPPAVGSVEAALALHTAPETISGYRAEGSAIESDATKRVQLLELPQVLVLHLMRFTYGAAGTGKLHKSVSYGPTLQLKASMLADGCTNARSGTTYDLLAAVQHHGRTPTGGHYTADVRAGGPGGEWMHFNDDRVASVGEADVLHGNAYLLVYSRRAGSH
eukprot:jgi/Tetstr1/424645/TSEL_015167.t1